MDSLALELIDEIIGHIDEKHGFRRFDLRTCSLVCRFWVPSSQRRLFHRIEFKDPLLQDRELRAQIQRLDEVILNSPHLANYIRELWLPNMSNVPPFIYAKPGLDEPLSLLLRKLTHVQKLDIVGLAWNDLPRDLRQSLCQVLQLPAMAFVCIYDAQFDCMEDFMNLIKHARSLTRPPDANKQLERCCISRLDMGFRYSNLASVSWLLGPRSHLDVSHIHTLHTCIPAEAADDSFNRLLCAIGSSLKHLFISLPCPCE
ncbi:hypothetical protein JB92DRAFT_3037946 [Gautieria morchelliformis]|nr:hypothetical protein JB92DRAFT_3037946 [Gautieria morchelliformis]